MIPDSILTNVTLIKTLSTEFAGQKITPIPVDIATGFFYSHAEKLYLITNKHVIYGDDFGAKRLRRESVCSASYCMKIRRI